MKNGKILPKSVKKYQFKFQINLKSFFIWLLVAGVILSFFISFPTKSTPTGEEIPLSQALAEIKDNKIKEVKVEEDKLILTSQDEKTFFSRKESQTSFTEILKTAEINPATVNLSIKDVSLSKIWINILGGILPIALMVLFFFFIFRQARGAQDSIFSFGRSKAQLFAKGKQAITFKDVAGVDEAKKELKEVVDFLKHPGKYRKLGARTPKGVLLVGPSGTGKTLLAKAVAGEAGVTFFSMAGSEFMEMLVGVGASVTGDTPVLIKKDDQVKLLPIGEVIDQYYQGKEEGRVIKVTDLQTLGFSKTTNRFWGTHSKQSKKMVFEKSAWQPIAGVYRHKVNQIYEIQFLGGVIRTTGDHSVFVRTHGGITPKRVDQLKAGEILVNLPMNVRKWDKIQKKTIHRLKFHEFPTETNLYLDFWHEDSEWQGKYAYVFAYEDQFSSRQIAEQIRVSQGTVLNWQKGIHTPQLLSRKLVKLDLPEKVKMTPHLMKIFGLYTAEGRATGCLEFTLGIKEKDLQKECLDLMRKVFDLTKPTLEKTKDNTVRIKYYSHHLGRFFSRFCGNGSHCKHVPGFIWDLPREYFLAYLEGWAKGDGYTTKQGKLSITSVSKQLILEMAWLCSMHGFKVGIKHEFQKGGRIIKNKPLPDLESWTLIIGKTSNPFLEEEIEYPHQIKRCLVKKVIKEPFKGYVYDFCGVENEGFFGGEKPILFHNSRVRDLFNNAKKAAPAIIFIDEIDAIGRQRGLGFTGGHDEREQTLNQILVEMDGFNPNDNVIILAATNRGDLLDPALLRPGRFDRRVVLDMPDLEDRQAILAIHARGKPFVKEVNWENVSRRTVGFSGADLENMLNEAAILAARENRNSINAEDIEEAATKVKLGPEKKRLQSEEERKMTAYHEAGHAVVSFVLPNIDPVHRISIVSRGMAMGFTLIPPKKDRYTETKSRLLETIATLLGGRAAEELIFNEFTAGAASDIDQATRIARQMVVDFGMSSLGPTYLGPQIETTEWGRSWMQPSEISPEMQAKVDREIKKIVDESYQRALEILKKAKKRLAVVADKLIKQETLEGEDFERLMKKN